MSTMVLFPAIDLLGGRCVRPRQGDAGQIGVAEEDPIETARRWRDQGASWLHIVDLDGARDGKPAHIELVEAIAAATGMAIQFGGGLREEADIATALEHGAARVVLGTAAASDAALLETCLARWGERIAVSIDARGNAVTVAGWLESASETVDDFATRMVGVRVSTLLMAEMNRDGTLAETASARLLRLRTAHPDVQLIAAGRIISEEHIRRLASAGVNGVVLGRALYDGTLDFAAALRIAAETAPAAEASTQTPDQMLSVDIAATPPTDEPPQ